MGLTVKVNGSMNGLVHKGSNHLANSTAPDVCKTPSPAGPVPIPYPIIVSMASDLVKGSTTVKADGGNMIAVKDCEYSMCTGDEAGTAGGVVSSTFKKEAKFILFSMDVKIDGKNACRLGDKMTMNHQNTICMAGTMPTAAGANPFVLDCEGFQSKERGGKGFTECEKKQICAKTVETNRQVEKKVVKRPTKAEKVKANAKRSAFNPKFRGEYADKLEALPNMEAKNEAVAKDSWHSCLDEERDGDDRMGGCDPDHVQELQFGGAPDDPANIKWMSSKPNRWMGSCFKSLEVGTHTGVQANCC